MALADTWNITAPDPDTWNDLEAATKSWEQLPSFKSSSDAAILAPIPELDIGVFLGSSDSILAKVAEASVLRPCASDILLSKVADVGLKIGMAAADSLLCQLAEAVAYKEFRDLETLTVAPIPELDIGVSLSSSDLLQMTLAELSKLNLAGDDSALIKVAEIVSFADKGGMRAADYLLPKLSDSALSLSLKSSDSLLHYVIESVAGLSLSGLSGKWISPVYDKGSAASQLRVYGDFRTVFESSSTTWNGVVPSPNTWDLLGASEFTWRQLFQPSEASYIRGKLKHRKLESDPWDTVDFFHILSAEVEARYFQVEIWIIDPSADSYANIKKLNMKAYSW